MNVTVTEEPQKKVFRARKTMKISDRQQLEFLHNSLNSSSNTNASFSPPPLVNGNHTGEEHTDSEKEGQSPSNNGQKMGHATFSASRSPSPLSLSLSLSPSPPCQTPVMRTPSPATSSPTQSPNAKKKEEGIKESPIAFENGRRNTELTVKGELIKEEEADLIVSHTKDGQLQSDKTSPSQSPYLGPTTSTLGPEKEEKETTMDDKIISSAEAMATDSPLATDCMDDDKTAGLSLNTSSPTSPSHAPESDQEVKEGFLFLSEEDENQGDKDEEKDNIANEKTEKDEKMEVDIMKEDRQEVAVCAPSLPSPQSSSSLPMGKEGGAGVAQAVKRVLSKDITDGLKDVGETVVKRPKVEGEEFEAQLELKISGDAGLRLKLEKVVQQLVEEQLRVLQLSVFDRSLQELRERVEKLDCATKHQQTLNTLQAKIARLAKKFGAANQAKENVRKPAEVASSPSTSSASPTPQLRSTTRTMAESKQAPHNQSVSPVGSTVKAQSPLRTSTPVSAVPAPAPVQSLISASAPSSCAPSSSATVTVASQCQPGAVMLKATPQSIVPSTALSPAAQPVSLQPLLIQLPLAGTMVTGLPVTSLPVASTVSKAKTTVPAKPLILQKSSTLASIPPLSTTQAPLLAAAQAVQPGGGGIASTPTSGGSASSVHTPAQGISAVGVSSSTSLPVASGPAATGGQSTGSAASGPVMASKTADSQPTSSSAKTPVQAPRPNGSGTVIDLTEDDDDVQVTGVKKAPVPSGHAVAASASSSSFSSTGRPLGAPPPLISTTSTIGTSLRSSPHASSHAVNGPQTAVPQRPSQARPANASSSAVPSPVNSSSAQPCALPPLPPLPSPPPPPVRLPPEAAHTSAPQQPQLKLARVQSQNGIVLSWCVAETDRSCAAVDSYHLYAYHLEHSGPVGVATTPSQWKKIGEVKALPLPMACTLTQFVSGSTYYFAVQARDVYGRFGPFCEPQCTDVISSSSSS